jgi:HD superfamily phosphohydrolase
MERTDLEVACPLYGFVSLDPDEREVVGSEPFQRLRRIRQLGWTDAVFPGAMHTRFEHSLGVPHVVSNLFDGLRARDEGEFRKHLRLGRNWAHAGAGPRGASSTA